VSTLTDAQRIDIRRWMGYPSLADDELDFVRWTSRYSSMTLTERLDALTSTEQTILVARFLDKLDTLEDAVTSAGDNLDTLEAGPWKANPREVQQRTALFKQLRRDLCAFLGFEPGPGLGPGGIQLMRG
jgi:hypothetical protein